MIYKTVEEHNGAAVTLAHLDHCAAKPKAGKLRIIATSPSDRNRVLWIPSVLAFAVARAVARDTNHTAVLYGVYGVAWFLGDGSGYIEWNSNSTMPGKVTEFDERTTVVIH